MLPPEWRDGGIVYLRFEGVVHMAQLYLNGAYLGAHGSSYGAFTVRLDNVSAAVWGGRNVVALRADASYGSEHWYGGGGITRGVYLVHAAAVSLVEDGVFVSPQLPSASSRDVTLSAEWQNAGAGAAVGAVRFDVLPITGNGAPLASVMTAAASLPPSAGRTAVATATLTLPDAIELWAVGSPAPPARYLVTATLLVGGVAVDAVNVTAGWRRAEWSPQTGFSLNGRVAKLRGCVPHDAGLCRSAVCGAVGATQLIAPRTCIAPPRRRRCLYEADAASRAVTAVSAM